MFHTIRDLRDALRATKSTHEKESAVTPDMSEYQKGVNEGTIATCDAVIMILEEML